MKRLLQILFTALYLCCCVLSYQSLKRDYLKPFGADHHRLTWTYESCLAALCLSAFGPVTLVLELIKEHGIDMHQEAAW
jgi:hypothetical protein